MARAPRLIVEGYPLHIVQRGHDRQPVFFCDDDYWKYLHDLKEAALSSGCAVHAYVLMTNHVHLLVTPTERDSAAKLLMDIGRRYVRYINGKYRRSGTLWEGRYKSCLVQSDRYLLSCSRYIEMNPVRAKMVTTPRQYPWSSYHHNARGKRNHLISEHETYLSLGNTVEQRQQAYQKLFDIHVAEEELAFIQRGFNRTGFLGNDRFKEAIEKMLGRQIHRLTHGGKRR